MWWISIINILASLNTTGAANAQNNSYCFSYSIDWKSKRVQRERVSGPRSHGYGEVQSQYGFQYFIAHSLNTSILPFYINLVKDTLPSECPQQWLSLFHLGICFWGSSPVFIQTHFSVSQTHILHLLFFSIVLKEFHQTGEDWVLRTECSWHRKPWKETPKFCC